MVTITADHSDAVGNPATQAMVAVSKRTQNISVRINSAFYATASIFDFGWVYTEEAASPQRWTFTIPAQGHSRSQMFMSTIQLILLYPAWNPER